MNKMVSIRTLVLIIIAITFTYLVYSKGVGDERQRKAEIARNRAEAQVIVTQKEWMSKINDNIYKLALDRGIEWINNF